MLLFCSWMSVRWWHPHSPLTRIISIWALIVIWQVNMQYLILNNEQNNKLCRILPEQLIKSKLPLLLALYTIKIVVGLMVYLSLKIIHNIIFLKSFHNIPKLTTNFIFFMSRALWEYMPNLRLKCENFSLHIWPYRNVNSLGLNVSSWFLQIRMQIFFTKYPIFSTFLLHFTQY